MRLPTGYGRINVTIGDSGNIESVSVEAALESAYAHMFTVASSEYEAHQDLFSAIRTIVFGCFWLEAICNKTLNEQLQWNLPTSAHPVLWRILNRRPFVEKFSVIAAFRGGDALQQADAVGSDLAKLFQLRNKLVHHKDEESVVAGPLTQEKFQELFPGGFADHPLMTDLQQPSIDRSVRAVTAAIAWFEAASSTPSPQRAEGSDGSSQDPSRP